MFWKNTFSIIYWLQLQTAQKMLDFDFLCDRKPSVLGFIDKWQKTSNHKLFYWNKEIIISSFPDFESIPDVILSQVDTCLNFASFRSAYGATLEILKVETIKNIVIIAEWIPESDTKKIIELNKTLGKNIIWPSTVWAMTSGEFRAWNTGWSLDNIISSKLFQKWVVWFVSKSGWMSNELRKIIADTTSWSHTSVAIWWDKYQISTFRDVVLSFEKNPEIKMIVLLWEVWWIEENLIWDMVKKGIIKKPVVWYCIWTISDLLPWEVQFWHAWAKADSKKESSNYKNNYLKSCWVVVPDSFIDFKDKIKSTFENLKDIKIIENNINIEEKLKIINNRKPTKITSSISDERGEELTLNKKPISTYVENGSIANVISNLWFKRDLPSYWDKFLNTVLILLSDHWPAVSGATNTIITSRAWNSIKDSLIAWLTTIWPRFWWAIDGAWKYFFEWVLNNTSPKDFVSNMKNAWIPIPWIWHKVKSKFNPDKRCEILLEISKTFPKTRHLDYALKIEELTLAKKPNLILNVDGMIWSMMIDLFENIGMSNEEIKNYIDSWVLNSFFILSRSIWFIWHALDQKILLQWLYRTSWDDILYI